MESIHVIFRLVGIWWLVLACALLAACNSDDDLPEGPDTNAPAAAIAFPGPVASTEGDTALVTGTASDASQITRVRVNGVDATTSDAYATWSATVPLVPGVNLLTVETTDEFSNIDAAAASAEVKSTFFWREPYGIAVDEVGKKAFVIDKEAKALVAIDLASRNSTVVSADGIPNSEYIFDKPVDVVFDATNNRVLVLDTSEDGVPADEQGGGIISVDPDTGARSRLAASDLFRNARAMAIDVANNRVLVTANTNHVLSVDLDTGISTTFYTGSIRDQFGRVFRDGIAVDASNNRALVVTAENQVIEIDLDTGEEDLFSDNRAYIGLSELNARRQQIVIDHARNRALLTQVNRSGVNVVAVDLDTGNRSRLNSISDGPRLDGSFSIAMDSANNRAFLSGSITQVVVTVDLDSGAHKLFSTNAVPEDQFQPVARSRTYSRATGLDIDTSNGRLLRATDSPRGSLLAVNLATGERTEFSKASGVFDLTVAEERDLVIASPQDSDDRNSYIRTFDLRTGKRTLLSQNGFPDTNNPFYVRPGEDGFLCPPLCAFPVPKLYVVADSARNRVLAADPYGGSSLTGRILAVDLTTGARTVLSDGRAGDMVIDTDNNRVLTLTEDIVAVDLDTGERTVLSSDLMFGPDDALEEPIGIALDAANKRALVTDLARQRLVAVDLASGERTVVSDNTMHDGVNAFRSPGAITVDPATNRAFVSDEGYRALIAVELATGERAIISR